jgi:hypothetical protein
MLQSSLGDALAYELNNPPAASSAHMSIVCFERKRMTASWFLDLGVMPGKAGGMVAKRT